MTLSLFRTNGSWRHLWDDQPIVSGRHPLHLYHGYLSALTLRETGSLCCYDPAFQAGYPVTPVFDGGSRPAILFLTLAGGSYQPFAYKLGLFVCCLLVPFCLLAAARAMGCCAASGLSATVMGTVLWWSQPGRQLLEMGDLDVLLAGLATLVSVAMLARFESQPGLLAWLGLVVAGSLGWYFHPILCITLLPMVLVFYFGSGNRHHIFWHVSLLAGLAVPLLINALWLDDLLNYWWLRSPLALDEPLLPHRTLRRLLDAPLWGDPLDRLLTGMLLLAAVAGIVLLNESRKRPAARLVGMGATIFLLLALAGTAWEPLGRLGTARVLVVGLWFCCLPAWYALTQLWYVLLPWLGNRRGLLATGGGLLGFSVLILTGTLEPAMTRCLGSHPLRFGLTSEQAALVDEVVAQTARESRILWEDTPSGVGSSHWTALLPILSERAFLGGLDPDLCMEHSQAGLVSGILAGRPLQTWNDFELDDYCRRFAIGWVVCSTQAAKTRFAALPGAQQLGSVLPDGQSLLFRLPPRSLLIRGQAESIRTDRNQIMLTGVVPEDGKVVLSLHYQVGMRVSPSRVVIEKEPNPRDPIPFVRLRVSDTLPRLSIQWEGP